MAKTFWDPGNLLLQIDFYGNDDEIQCVGRTRFDVRCKWTITGQAYARVQSNVAELAGKRPSDIKADELAVLAGQCLCEQYHQNQRLEVARHWRAVVSKAVDHCARAGRNDSVPAKEPAQSTRQLTPEDEDIIDVRLRLVRAQMDLTQSNAANAELQKELAGTQDTLTKTTREYQLVKESVAKLCLVKNFLETANTELTNLRERAEADAQSKATVLQQNITRMNDEAESRKARLEDALDLNKKLRDDNKRLKTDQESLYQELEKFRKDSDQLRTDAEKLRSERSSLADQVERLHVSFSTATQEKLRLTTEIEAFTHALQQSRADVQGGRNVISDLSAETGSLSKRIRDMEQNIAGCSLHSLGTRIGDIKRKLIRSSKQPSSTA